ncbi:MAG: exodeoxyribonuclease III [Planctomycetota bacterium]
MKLVSWNVNGLRAIVKKGFLEWLEDYDPDVLLLQEVKCRPEDLDDELRELPGFFSRVFPAKRRGYSGVAIYTRFEPDAWIEGIGAEEFDHEGRVLSARFGRLLVSSAYFPNSQEAGARLPYKLAFCDALARFLAGQREAGRHVLVGGDYNIAHERIDIARPEENVHSPGFLPEEREWMGAFLASGYKDSWRAQNPGKTDCYSWWSFRKAARERNIGWRIDYFCVNEEFWPDVRSTGILMKVGGSDHCPVTIDIKNPK